MSTKRRTAPKADDPVQYERFLEAAKNAEADESEEGADRAFKKVTRQKGVSNRDFPDRKK